MRWLQANKAKSRQSRVRVAPPPANQKFDDQTGQIYTETTVDATRPTDFNWVHQSERDRGRGGRDCTKDYSYTYFSGSRPGPGPRSLVDIAAESILQNVHSLSVEALRDVPPVLLSKLWAQLQARSVRADYAGGVEC